MSILFPNVPNFGGIPAVRRLTQIAGIVGTAVTALARLFAAPPVYGIFDADGKKVLEPTSFYEFDGAAEARVSDFPIERGSFSSYNKILLPKSIRLTVTKQGTESERAAFLSQVDELRASFSLLTIITPTAPKGGFSSFSLTGFNFRQSAQSGVGLLIVELIFEEIRENLVATYSNSKSPGGLAPKQVGTVQPSAATPSQQAGIAGGSGIA